MAACNSPPDYPPPPPDNDAQTHLGGHASGGGAEASVSPCVLALGVCMEPGDGNICPTQVSDFSCSTDSDADTSATVERVCCMGYNDAGAPDVGQDP